MGGRLGDSFALPGQRGQGGRSMDRFSRPLISHALGVGRPRTPLGQVDSGAQWRSWREGLRLANQQLGSLDGQFQAATLLHSNPFSQYGTLRRSPVLQVSFPSKESPEGRWTVTVLPRGIQRSLAPLSEAGQREITARWQQVVGGVVVERSWRLLRVQVGPVWNEGGGVEADLVGELVEDSLSSATRFIQASISTSPLSCCWAMAGSRPSAFQGRPSSTSASGRPAPLGIFSVCFNIVTLARPEKLRSPDDTPGRWSHERASRRGCG